ncbi:SWIM zinc finger family protein [Priestia aryabhattai]|uniref:SWIM zinc finger family protein n=1 Tax=Priestia megaterium TaxID=1404 RepID=UPI003F9DD690
MTTSNTQTLFQSFDRAMMESLKVYRNGGIGLEGNFVVVNHESVDAYEVKVEQGIIKECTCPHSHWRKAVCKHMIKVGLIHNMDIEQLKRP